LWVCGVEPRPARIHAVTSERVLTVRDPWINVLRNTMGVLGGALGGAEWITSLPFDGVNGTPTSLGRRVARQTQHVLAHEARLASTVDLAGGSGLIETYTESLAAAAWAKLQEIESLGGLECALVSGAIHKQVAQVRERRAKQIRTRVDTKVGVSNYVQLDAPSSPAPQPTDSPSSSSDGGVEVCRPLPAWRDAQLHDALRDAADAWAVAHGGFPGVAVRTLGPVKGHGDRLTWVMHVLASAGVRAETSPFTAGEQISGTVVLCGSQAAYDACEEGAVAQLKAAGAKHVWVVGTPNERDADLAQGHFAEGLDLVERLEQLHRDLGVGT
jgi:methylmalonyl-CoA mutase